MMLPPIAKIFLVIGIFFIILAAVFYVASRLNIPLGKLPGDIQIQGKGYSCFFPLASSIVISIILSILLTIITQFLGRK